MMRQVKIIIEKHTDGYVAYPLGVKGVVIGEGDTYEAALADVQSALAFHIETFGTQALEPEGTRVLVTLLLEDEADFWLGASSASLDEVWANAEDDRYAELLEA